MIRVHHISTPQDQEIAYQIRRRVFVEEQKVSPEEEYDEYEATSRHFLATDPQGTPCGTARWRFTDKGIKLERFAVLATHRRKGVGSALVQAVLDDIALQPHASGKMLYMHAQIAAMGLYTKFGFQAVGDMFDEAGIQHYKMILPAA